MRAGAPHWSHIFGKGVGRFVSASKKINAASATSQRLHTFQKRPEDAEAGSGLAGSAADAATGLRAPPRTEHPAHYAFGLVRQPMLILWIPAFAGMTRKQLISVALGYSGSGYVALTIITRMERNQARRDGIENDELYYRAVFRIAHVHVPVLGCLAHDGLIAEFQFEDIILRVVDGFHDEISHAK
ncbi:MAG TPA: hypothetical protein VFL96_05705 [Acidobacteriaceae bacterium]|nr:hypothetical protein [Acidobacteriaceae bacterium]